MGPACPVISFFVLVFFVLFLNGCFVVFRQPDYFKTILINPESSEENKTYEDFIWNMGTRSTHNMSYDLRGDPCIIRPNHYLWNNPSHFTYYYDRPFCDELI